MGPSHVWECVHTTKLYMYRLSDNFKSFFDLISTHTVYKLSNLNRTFVLVCTFTIQSFISYRQSMGPSHVWECVHTTKLYMYRLSDNFKSLFDLISIHTVYKLSNLNRTFVLVYTFTIQSFISYRQSMGPSHVWECVHTTKLYMYQLSDNFKSFFDLISTHTVYKLPNLNRTFVLVYTFTIQSFISYRQSMGPSHVWECVHAYNQTLHVSVKWQF